MPGLHLMPIVAHRQIAPYGDDYLPQTAVRAAQRQEVLVLLKKLSGRTRYQSMTDMVLGTLLPQFLPEIKEFYAGTGPDMAGLYTPEAVAHVDRLLARILEHLGTIYDEICRQGWKHGMAVPDAIKVVVDRLRIEPVTLVRLPPSAS